MGAIDMSFIQSKLTNLNGNVTGVLPIANGGTNSSAALNNNRVIISSGGAIVEEAAITASRALASDTNGLPTASVTTATELGYVSGVTSSIQTQINNLQPQAPTVNAWVYVSDLGSDVTGDGTYNKPFATTAAALAIITDASTSKRYGVHIRGTISETNIYIKPYVWYYGDTWGNARLSASSGNITLSPGAYTTGNSRSGFTNIYLTGTTGISLDFVAASASGSHVVEITQVGINGSVTINPNNTNQYFQWEGNSLVFGNMTFHGALGLVFNTFLFGNLTVDQMATAQATGGINFVNMFVGGTTSISSSGSFANPVQMTVCTLTGATTVTGTGATLTADAISIPLKANITVSGGGVLTRTSDVNGLAYSPTTSADWNSVPTTGQTGLDTLATSGVVKSQTQNKVLASPNGSSGVPSFRALVSGDLPAGTGTVTSVAVSGGTTGITTSGGPITTSGTITLAGTLATTNGGTGVTSVTTAPAATAFAGWDANKNLSANSFIPGYATTATAAGTTTLTVSSAQQQYFTGTTTQTVVMPVVSTLVLGQQFQIVNNSTGVVTVQSSGANTILAMAASSAATFTVISTSGTTAASWNYEYTLQAGGSGTVTSVAVSGGTTGLTTSGGPITTSGTITLAGTLAVANGGTGVTSSTGSTNVVLSNGPTLVAPVLGTPASGTLSNCTQLGGVTTGSGVGSGIVGQYIENARTSVTPAWTSATIASIDSGNVTFNDGNETGITLGAGIWDIEGGATWAASGVITVCQIFIGTAKGNSSTGLDNARNNAGISASFEPVGPLTGLANAACALSTPRYRVNLSGNTTYYLKGYALFSSGTTNAVGCIRATRVA